MKNPTYKDAGVDIEKGDRFAAFIKKMNSPAIGGNIGSFAGGLELDLSKYTNPVMLSATDGVGTKLLVAKKLGKFDTLGIDLVAMCVNDLIVCGAAPMMFLDYIATGKIDETVLQSLMKGIVNGCEQADCVLAGGETAEMPDVYSKDDFDLAGFSVGLVEKKHLLPKKSNMRAGDIILGLPSTGIHSNGLSLARKAIAGEPESIWAELLTPTKIYINSVDHLIHQDCILGAAHITGGGLTGNIARICPDNCRPKLYRNWPVPDIFNRIKTSGNLSSGEMDKVFNMGIGLALVVKKSEAEQLLEILQVRVPDAMIIGELVRG